MVGNAFTRSESRTRRAGVEREAGAAPASRLRTSIEDLRSSRGSAFISGRVLPIGPEGNSGIFRSRGAPYTSPLSPPGSGGCQSGGGGMRSSGWMLTRKPASQPFITMRRRAIRQPPSSRTKRS